MEQPAPELKKFVVLRTLVGPSKDCYFWGLNSLNAEYLEDGTRAYERIFETDSKEEAQAKFNELFRPTDVILAYLQHLEGLLAGTP